MTAEILQFRAQNESTHIPEHKPSIVHIDFETRSDLDLKKVGLDAYAKHPSTEVLCMAYSTDESPVRLWLPGQPLPGELVDYTTTFYAYNALFEYYIFKYVMGAPHELHQFRDVMAVAAANNCPQSLEDCAIFLGLSEQKDKTGSQLIQKLCKPKKDGTFNNDPELLQQLYDYCMQDVRTEMAIHKALQPLSDVEEKVWQITNKINELGVPVDRKGCLNAINAVNLEHQKVNDICHSIAGCRPNQVAKILEFLSSRGLELPDLTADTVRKELAKDHPADVKAVLEARQQGSQTAVAKYNKILELQMGDRVRNTLIYHGASTGRWASRGGLNLQNIARPTLSDEDIVKAERRILEEGGSGTIDELSSLVRSVILARDNWTFVDMDFSSIENRVSSWLAEQDDKVDMFRKGLDEYKVFASQMYNVEYEAVDKQQRQVAKSAVLGSMFGQGAKGLVAYAEKMGVNLSTNEAEALVKNYRTAYRKVQSMWYKLAEEAMQAVKTPGLITQYNKIKFKMVKDALYMQLPSDRLICWQRPRIEQVTTPWGDVRPGLTVHSQNTYTRSWSRNNLIGSSIFQSAVQATARDFLAHAMIELDNMGFHIVNLIHDEILIEVPDEKAQQAYKVVLQTMSTPPSWAEGFPLDADGWVSKRYKK